MKTKQVNYAYPTSDIAKRYGFPKLGCWIVEIGVGSYTPWPKEIVSVWPTEREAIARAHRIDLPWSECWISCQKSPYTSTIKPPKSRFQLCEDLPGSY